MIVKIATRYLWAECLSSAASSREDCGQVQRLVADMEVDAGGEAEAVLDVLCAVGETRVDDVHLHHAEIEAVIDVEVHAAAASRSSEEALLVRTPLTGYWPEVAKA